MRSVASVCLSACMYVYNAVTFESLDLESSFLGMLVQLRIESSGQLHISRSSAQGQGHRSKNAFEGGRCLPSIEKVDLVKLIKLNTHPKQPRAGPHVGACTLCPKKRSPFYFSNNSVKT